MFTVKKTIIFSHIFPIVLTSELSEAEDCGFSERESGRQSGYVSAVISAASKYFLCDVKKRSCQCQVTETLFSCCVKLLGGLKLLSEQV